MTWLLRQRNETRSLPRPVGPPPVQDFDAGAPLLLLYQELSKLSKNCTWNFPRKVSVPRKVSILYSHILNTSSGGKSLRHLTFYPDSVNNQDAYRRNFLDCQIRAHSAQSEIRVCWCGSGSVIRQVHRTMKQKYITLLHFNSLQT